MRSLISIFFMLFFYTAFPQHYTPPEYKLVDKCENADLNYTAIDSINWKAKGMVLMDSVFNVVKGNYIVYRYLTSDRGILYDDSGEHNMNNLVILKVNKKNKIVDGYQYFLQNPVMPSNCFLYRISKSKKLKPKIKVREMKFKKVHKEIKGYEVCPEVSLYLKDNRTLTFKIKMD